MIVELQHLTQVNDLFEVKDWVMKNSPNSKLLIKYKPDQFISASSFSLQKWSEIPWDDIFMHDTQVEYYSKYFIIGVDIPGEDAVYFKLVWG